MSHVRDPDTTPTTPDSVRAYLKEIGRVRLLTAQQEVSLAKRMEAGLAAAERLAGVREHGEQLAPAEERRLRRVQASGEAAKRELVEANLRLVVSIARRSAHQGVPLLDLIQEGNLGLIHATEKFDYRRGFKFSTYATWWIRQAITRALANQARTIRLPVHVVDAVNSLVAVRRRLTQRLNREPTFDEIAAETGTTPERVRQMLKLTQEPVSLATPVGEDGDTELGDFLEDTAAPVPLDEAHASLLRRQLARALGALGPREQRVIELRFGLRDGKPRTLEEVGREFGITRERVRQIERKTLKKLREAESAERLRQYVE